MGIRRFTSLENNCPVKIALFLRAWMKVVCLVNNRVRIANGDEHMAGFKNERPAGYPTGLSYHIPVLLYLSHLFRLSLHYQLPVRYRLRCRELVLIEWIFAAMCRPFV